MLTAERGGIFRPGWHDKLSEPINTAPIDRLAERLEPQQVGVRRAGHRPTPERFGYRPCPPDAAPEPEDLARFEAPDGAGVAKWRREDRDELKRRLYVSRAPIAAIAQRSPR